MTKAKNLANMSAEELDARLQAIDEERKALSKARRNAKAKEKREAAKREAEAEAKRVAEEKDALYAWANEKTMTIRDSTGLPVRKTIFEVFAAERH